MTQQLCFTFSGLTCALGEDWEGAHPRCEQETARARVDFAEAVARGEFDAEGYTPNERRAQAKRAKAAYAS